MTATLGEVAAGREPVCWAGCSGHREQPTGGWGTLCTGRPRPARPQTLQESQHHYEIPDAWSGLRHVVQLRAQEEFGNGRWSEWSQEVMGTPWTGADWGAASSAVRKFWFPTPTVNYVYFKYFI